GEMGIGNTTTSSAVTAALLQVPAKDVTGKGAGLSKEGITHKAKIIEDAIAYHHLTPDEPWEILRKVGGFDLAAMVGVYLGGAFFEVPIVIDGFISSAAALLATRLCEPCKYTMVASHQSGEPAAQMLMEELNLNPIIKCRLSLGEGTGAVAVMPLLEMALSEYRNMPTFTDIQIEEYKPL
uniref:nicotinate-nucleotide--dimethylbenzimidazole phosphoribosyltransferase n=1 Tax=Lachnoclostridium sp. TaxID=2028282 RepID=UPI00289A4320